MMNQGSLVHRVSDRNPRGIVDVGGKAGEGGNAKDLVDFSLDIFIVLIKFEHLVSIRGCI